MLGCMTWPKVTVCSVVVVCVVGNAVNPVVVEVVVVTALTVVWVPCWKTMVVGPVEVIVVVVNDEEMEVKVVSVVVEVAVVDVVVVKLVDVTEVTVATSRKFEAKSPAPKPVTVIR